MEEIQKDIKDYEGLYQVSNLGRVRSLSNQLHKEPIIRKQYISKRGYYCISLRKGKEIKTWLVHRLVAEAFIPNPDNLPQVGHKDENNFKTGDGCNNYVDNLEWTTAKDNSNMPQHIKKLSGDNHPNYGKPLSEDTKEKIRNTKAQYNPNKGVPRTEEVKKKISEANKGKIFTDEHRRNMSLSKSIPVRCIETGIIYYGATEAQRQTGCNASDIRKCCRGIQKTSKGLHWEYVNIKEEKDEKQD